MKSVRFAAIETTSVYGPSGVFQRGKLMLVVDGVTGELGFWGETGQVTTVFDAVKEYLGIDFRVKAWVPYAIVNNTTIPVEVSVIIAGRDGREYGGHAKGYCVVVVSVMAFIQAVNKLVAAENCDAPTVAGEASL